MRATHFFLFMAGAIMAIACGGCVTDTGDPNQLKAGYAALDQKQYDQAVSAADRQIHQTGSSAEAEYLKGRGIYGRTKADQGQAIADMQEARNCYIRALTLNPSPALEGLIHSDLANVAYHQDDYRTAEAEWTRAFDKVDDNSVKGVVLYQIGRSRQRQAKWHEADEAFAAVEQNWPDTDLARTAHDKRGWTAFYVQVATYSQPATADVAMASLRAKGYAVAKKVLAPNRQVVLVGPQPTYAAAVAARQGLLGTYKDALIAP